MVQDFAEIIENDLETLFKTQLVKANTGDNLDWSVARYYGAASVEGMAMFLYNKIQAGVPSVFISVDGIDFEDLSTRGDLTLAKIKIRIIVAANIIKDDQLQPSNRFVNHMVQQVLNAMDGHDVSIDGVPFNYRITGIANLFRIKKMDAKQLTLSIEGLPVEL